MSKVKAYLQLLRPANVLTAIAEPAAAAYLAWGTIGMCFEGFNSLLHSPISNGPSPLYFIAFSAIIYAAGIALNDYCDADLDRLERPERPIPSGKITKSEALILILFLALSAIGILWVSALRWEGLLSGFALILSVTLYDSWAKNQGWLGPVVMGMCRALSFATPLIAWFGFTPWAFFCFIHFIYVALITFVAKGEVYGGKKLPIALGGIVLASLPLVVQFLGPAEPNFVIAIATFVFLAYVIGEAFTNAYSTLSPISIRTLVGVMVKSLVLINGMIAASAGCSRNFVGFMLLFLAADYVGKKFSIS